MAKKGLGGTGHEVSVMSGPVIEPLLRSPPLPHVQCGRALVEHYGLGVLVCHLGHMTEDIFFCDNTKEASAERERGGEEDRQRKRESKMYHRYGACGRCMVFFVGRVVNKLTITKILLNWVGNMAKHHY